jgi:hypothetical protein
MKEYEIKLLCEYLDKPVCTETVDAFCTWNGFGELYEFVHQYHNSKFVTCWKCNGTGVEELEYQPNTSGLTPKTCVFCSGRKEVKICHWNWETFYNFLYEKRFYYRDQFLGNDCNGSHYQSVKESPSFKHAFEIIDPIKFTELFIVFLQLNKDRIW